MSGPGSSLGKARSTKAALAGYVSILKGCADRGMAPLVTLLHFTHPAWLGEEFWLRADSSERYVAWVEVALGALAGLCRHWVTLNEINAVGLGSWVLGMFPPGRRMAFGDAAVAMDNQLAAHVLGYEAIHRARPDAIVTTNDRVGEPLRVRCPPHRHTHGPEHGYRP